MKKFLLTILLAAVAISSYAGNMPLTDDEEAQRQILVYQIKISEKTAKAIQEIFNNFNDSFIDYEPALTKVSVLINEYNKAMDLIPGEIPEDGRKLDELVKVMLSRIETYFLHYKLAGREDPYINYQIFLATNEVMRETERLSYAYR